MMKRTTVNERAKATGGLMVGPTHPAFRDLGPQNAEKMDEGKPPNLRDAGPVGPTCKDCAHFEAGMCNKHQYPVNDNEISDDFEPIEGAEPAESGVLDEVA